MECFGGLFWVMVRRDKRKRIGEKNSYSGGKSLGVTRSSRKPVSSECVKRSYPVVAVGNPAKFAREMLRLVRLRPYVERDRTDRWYDEEVQITRLQSSRRSYWSVEGKRRRTHMEKPSEAGIWAPWTHGGPERVAAMPEEGCGNKDETHGATSRFPGTNPWKFGAAL